MRQNRKENDMRITRNLLNDASMQAGMQLTRGTLASYLNEDSADTLVGALGEKQSSVTNGLSKGKYQKLQKAAEELEESAGKLNEAGTGSIYDKARESGDASTVYEEVEKLVASYNGLLEKMSFDISTLGRFYQASLKEAAAEHKKALGEIGVSVDKNGRLNVEKEKLKAADIGKVERIFGKEGTFSPKLYLIAAKVADSAQANLKSVSSQYNAAGNSVDTLLRSYDAKR